jgi:hypothetical protein
MGTMDRRGFLRRGGMVVGGSLAAGSLPLLHAGAGVLVAAKSKADYTLRIESCNLEIAPGVVVKTTAYNGQVPGRCCGCARGLRRRLM